MNQLLSKRGNAWPALAVVTLVLASFTQPASADLTPRRPVASSHGNFDDGWRLTASGWEHISTWEHPPILASRSLVPLPHIEGPPKGALHPVTFTVLMMLASWAALLFLPGGKKVEQRR
jgi:hypothetical protein